MTTQQAKKWLMRARNIDKEVNVLITEQAAAFERATKTTSAAGGERVQTSACNGSESKFIKYSEYSALIDKRIDELYDVKCEILSAISKIDENNLRTLLELRYLHFATWETISEKMGYKDVRHIYRLHRRALKKMEGIIPPPNMR